MIEYILLSQAIRGNTIASADAASAKSSANSAAGATERLELRVATLELTLETLLRMIIESGQFNEDEFIKKLQVIDAEDGRVDGRRDIYKLRRQCPKCAKFSAGDRAGCMWCGENIQRVKPTRLE